MAPPPKPKFSDGEKVLCFHGPLLYEAKCMKHQVKEKHVKYFIHYSGWNKNWDEWVPESRVLKYNDVNMQKQKDLEAAHGKAKKSKAAKGGPKKESTDRESTALPPQEKTSKQKSKEVTTPVASTSAESQAESQRKKRQTRAEQNVETEEEYTQKIEIKVRIPDELKHRLVDDWDLVNRQRKLVQLPAHITVEGIISNYIAHKKASIKGMNPNKETAIMETCNGIREYFNVMLGKQLLYKFERPQYLDLLSENQDMTPSQIYGAIHLLRLFTKIGGALAYTPLDEDTVNLITSHLYDFQKYMAKCAGTLFGPNDYVLATPEHLKRVKTEREVKSEVNVKSED